MKNHTFFIPISRTTTSTPDGTSSHNGFNPDSAIQIGMTATPRETKYVSNIGYFGEPVYSYSLKQGIDDGFLAPFKVIRVDLDVDLQGWRPEAGMVDDAGNLIDDRNYNQVDINRENYNL